MKKAVLISGSNDFAGNANVVRFTSLLAPPMGVLAVGSYLEAQGVPVEIIDVQMDFGFGLTHAAERIVARRVAHHLAQQSDAIAWVGISQLSNSGNGILLARTIHDVLPDKPILLGGYFPSTTYPVLLEKHPFITGIVRGDGEAAALEISLRLNEGRTFLSQDVPNLTWLDDDGIHISPQGSVSLNTLSFLNFGLLKNPTCYQIVDLMTSRGCPFECNYCLEGCMRSYAEHSVEWVDRQLDHLESFLPNERIFIYDPVFGLNRRRTMELCEVLGSHSFSYAVESRVDVLEPSLVSNLREAGVETIFLGIESASSSTLVRMNKVRSQAQARSYVKKALRVLEACFESDVTPVMGFMLGFPGDKESDYQDTVAFVEKVGELHNNVTRRTGVMTGFVPFAFYTKIYSGSPLAEELARSYPQTILGPEQFVGESAAVSPSKDLSLEVTQQYQARVVELGNYTSLALERLWHYFSFSMETFLQDHPDLTNSQGVTLLGDSLKRFPQSFDVASAAFSHFYKSKADGSGDTGSEGG